VAPLVLSGWLSEPWSWALGGSAIGAFGCFASGQFGLQLGGRASSRVAAVIVRTGQTHVVSIALRAGAAIAIGAEVLALLAVLGLVALLPFQLEALFRARAAYAVGGLASGALSLALVTQLAGSCVQHAGLQTRREPPFGPQRERYQLQAQNPGLILDLMGGHAGGGVVRAQNAFCTALLSHLLPLLLASHLGPTATFALDARWLLLFVLLRAIGILSCCFSVLSMRADEGDDTTLVLWRGHLATIVLSCAGLCGALVWAVGNDWLAWFVAGAVGLLASTGVAFFQLARGQRNDGNAAFEGASREHPRPSLGHTLGRALGRALQSAWRPLALLAIGVTVAAFMGGNTGHADGTVTALCLLLTGLGMTLPYAGCLASFDPIIETAVAQASLDPAHQRPEFHQRAQKLNHAAACAGQVGTVHYTLATVLFALLTSTALLGSGTLGTVTSSAPFAWIGALLGVATVLGFAGVVVRHALDGTWATLGELQQQLQDLPRGPEGGPHLSPGFRPRYTEPLSVACERALAPRGLLVVGATLLPWLLVSLLPTVSGWAGVGATAVLACALLACAGLTATALSLIARAAFNVLGSTRRQRHGADSFSVLEGSDGAAELLGTVLAPSLQLVAKGTLAACLALAPILLTVH
jgi:hypothetical protein